MDKICFRLCKNLNIEVRTKSSNFKIIETIDSNENIILSWTISPEIICKSYEHSAPPLSKRIKAIKSAIDNGWKVRLCIDPVMNIENWEDIYTRFFFHICFKMWIVKKYLILAWEHLE